MKIDAIKPHHVFSHYKISNDPILADQIFVQVLICSR